MAWVYLFVAGLFEVGWAVGLKYTEGFTRLWPTVFTAVSLIASMALLAAAMRTLQLGTAYAVWTGIGTIGTVLFGMFFLAEPVTALRMLCLSMIVVGIVGLKLVSA